MTKHIEIALSKGIIVPAEPVLDNTVPDASSKEITEAAQGLEQSLLLYR